VGTLSSPTALLYHVPNADNSDKFICAKLTHVPYLLLSDPRIAAIGLDYAMSNGRMIGELFGKHIKLWSVTKYDRQPQHLFI
jgi:hypothetical protein